MGHSKKEKYFNFWTKPSLWASTFLLYIIHTFRIIVNTQSRKKVILSSNISLFAGIILGNIHQSEGAKSAKEENLEQAGI